MGEESIHCKWHQRHSHPAGTSRYGRRAPIVIAVVWPVIRFRAQSQAWSCQWLVLHPGRTGKHTCKIHPGGTAKENETQRGRVPSDLRDRKLTVGEVADDGQREIHQLGGFGVPLAPHPRRQVEEMKEMGEGEACDEHDEEVHRCISIVVIGRVPVVEVKVTVSHVPCRSSTARLEHTSISISETSMRTSPVRACTCPCGTSAASPADQDRGAPW